MSPSLSPCPAGSDISIPCTASPFSPLTLAYLSLICTAPTTPLKPYPPIGQDTLLAIPLPSRHPDPHLLSFRYVVASAESLSSSPHQATTQAFKPKSRMVSPLVCPQDFVPLHLYQWLFVPLQISQFLGKGHFIQICVSSKRFLSQARRCAQFSFY